MNIEKMITSLKDCSVEELERINEAIQETRLNKYRSCYDEISSHIQNILAKYGKDGFGLIIKDDYGNDISLLPSEMSHEKVTIDVYHKIDKEKWIGLDLNLDYYEDED